MCTISSRECCWPSDTLKINALFPSIIKHFKVSIVHIQQMVKPQENILQFDKMPVQIRGQHGSILNVDR